jgi:ABC-type transport system substrate-binding protein
MESSLTGPIRARVCLACAVMCLAATVGCGRGPNQPVPPPTLRIGFGLGPSGRAPGLNVLADLLYAEPLIALNAHGQPVGRLAEDWTWEDEYRTLRIELRKGTKLHDGRTLNAQLARQFLQAQIDAVQSGDHAGSFDGVQSIEILSESTMRLHLRRVDAFLLAEFNNAFLVDPAFPDIGTGPFRLLSRKPLKAERFQDHHRGAPVIHDVQIQTYDSQRAAWAALMRDEVDAVQEVNRDSAEFLEGSNVKTFASLRPYYWALSFNLAHPDLRSADVRRALTKAVDRDQIVAKVLRGYATPAIDPVWPLFWAYPATAARDEYDPAGARAQLKMAAGGASGRRRIRFRCLFYVEDPRVERMALMLQRQMSEVGVEMELQPSTLQEMPERMRKGDFEAVLLLFASGRALDWTYRFWHSPVEGQDPIQLNGYTGADRALDELRVAFAEGDVRDNVRKLREEFHLDPPAVFIAWQQVTRAVSSRFDISEADQQDVFANIWQWKPAASSK